MIKGVTSEGFNYEIDEKRLSDWRILKQLQALQALDQRKDESGVELDFIRIMANIESLIFDDHGEALENHVAENNDGSVPADVLLKELLEVLKSNSKTKNS